jgi:hypothetical protein
MPGTPGIVARTALIGGAFFSGSMLILIYLIIY